MRIVTRPESHCTLRCGLLLRPDILDLKVRDDLMPAYLGVRMRLERIVVKLAVMHDDSVSILSRPNILNRGSVVCWDSGNPKLSGQASMAFWNRTAD